MTDAPPPLPTRAAARPRLLPRIGRRAVCLLAWITLAASVYAGWESLHWTVRVVCPFRPQLLLAGLLLLTASVLLRNGRVTRVVCGAVMAVNLAVLWPWLAPSMAPVPEPSFRLLSWNTWIDHPDPTQVARMVENSGAAVALLCEIPEPWRQSPPPVIPGYATRITTEYVIAVREGGPVSLVSVEHARPPNALEARVLFEGKEIRLLVCHATRPTTKQGCWLQDMHNQALRRWFDTSPLPTVITGDFNQTPWCPRLSELVHDLRLTDASRGQGLTYTFPGDAPGLGRVIGIMIDQCLCTPELACGKHWVGPASGSNHRPVFTDIGWRAP